MDKILKEYPSGHKVVEGNVRHVQYLAENMREEDLVEVNCFGGDPAKSLMRGLISDDKTYTVLDPQDIPYAMFGAGMAGGDAYIWMLGTPDIVKYKFEFAKRCRPWVHALVREYGTVFNYVHHKNELATKWLLWCGATLGEPLEVSGETFHQFKITKDDI